MTDIPDPESPEGANGNDGEGGGGNSFIHAHAQYIKDLSFENPLALEVATSEDLNPQVNVNCSVDASQLGDQTYEVVLSLEARAIREEKTLFLISIDYAGLFSLTNVPDEHLGSILNIHCPTLLFPFARSIIANMTRDGGYPALMIDMIDFSTLYERGLKAMKDNTGGENGGSDASTDGDGA
ncbi:MAG: protein-export chaperone SecB [Alphaproteobacteria bacterium]|nr:protein-export chaperone SecB [Alphaproteobacteria bacterium]